MKDGEVVQGSPAFAYGDFAKSFIHFKNLPKIIKDIEELKGKKDTIMVKQTTIGQEISLTGVGLHTGQNVTMTFKPAPVNNGITFVRVDLEGQPIIEADANYVVNTIAWNKFRKIGGDDSNSRARFAAVVGCDVDNIIIELDALRSCL